MKPNTEISNSSRHQDLAKTKKLDFLGMKVGAEGEGGGEVKVDGGESRPALCLLLNPITTPVNSSTDPVFRFQLPPSTRHCNKSVMHKFIEGVCFWVSITTTHPRNESATATTLPPPATNLAGFCKFGQIGFNFWVANLVQSALLPYCGIIQTSTSSFSLPPDGKSHK